MSDSNQLDREEDGVSYKMTSMEPYMNQPPLTAEEEAYWAERLTLAEAVWTERHGQPFGEPLPLVSDEMGEPIDPVEHDRKNEEEVRVRREARLKREREEVEKNSHQ